MNEQQAMKVGLMGTGLMGNPMGIRLLNAGLTVTVYNRTASKLQSLEEAGAIALSRPQLVLESADYIILMLTDAQAINQVLFDSKPDNSKQLELLQNKLVIQMATIAPDQSKAISDRVSAAGGSYLEAPVLGSIPQVKTGELIIMVGGSSQNFERSLPLLKNFSPQPILVGEVGAASAMKLALNQLIAGLTSSFALSLGFVKKQNVDVEQFMQILRDSALYAPTFDKKLTRMSDRNFSNPNFPTKHLLKDTNLFLEQAQSIGLATDSLTGIQAIIQKAITLGLENEDYSAIYQAIDPE